MVPVPAALRVGLLGGAAGPVSSPLTAGVSDAALKTGSPAVLFAANGIRREIMIEGNVLLEDDDDVLDRRRRHRILRPGRCRQAGRDHHRRGKCRIMLVPWKVVISHGLSLFRFGVRRWIRSTLAAGIASAPPTRPSPDFPRLIARAK